MEIKLRNNEFGECKIESYIDIPKETEYAIKSLCMLQLMCISYTENDEMFKKISKLINELTGKIENLYSEKEKEITYNGSSQF